LTVGPIPRSGHSAEKLPKNFRHDRTSCHAGTLCTPLCTTWWRMRSDMPLGTQRIRCAQRVPPPCTPFHSQLTPGHACRTASTRVHPQRPQALILLLVYLRRGLLRRSPLGTHRIGPRDTGWRSAVSPRSISFQVEAESSTVVHRQPLRSSQRIVVTRGETPRNRWLELVVVLIEGTLWTWLQRRLVSLI
jgi:hypothetical protein